MLRPDTPLGQLLSWVFNLLALSLLYLVSSLPLVTVGASTLALYEEVYAVLEGRDGVLIKDYFDAFRRNLRKGFGMLAVYALAALLTGGVGGALILLGAPVRLSLALVLAIIAGLVCWVAALAGRYEQKLGITVQNAYLIGTRNLPVTLLLSLLQLGPIALVWLLPEELLRWYLFLLLFFLPAGCAFLSAALVLRVLRRQYPDDEGNAE